jgi:putative ABC transport system permease protein
VRALERKLTRDLWQLRGQVLTVALVVAGGIAGFTALRSTYSSVVQTRDSYYADYRFGDVFAHLRRAPESLRPRLEAIPGVALVYTRIVEYVRLPMETETQPPLATLVTIPDGRRAPLNDLRLERGRLPAADGGAEALLLEAFAVRHGIALGDTLPVVIKGVRHLVRIVGLANAPEFIYAVQPGSASMDEARTAVLWMNRRAVAPALGMEGAFNDVVLRLAPGASADAAMAQADRLLAAYGGLGSVPRRLQPSNSMISGEVEQLRSYATTVPVVFLAVSAFLLNVVLSRLVELQRGQIATLKAVGYSDRTIGLHYLELVCVIVLTGTALGLGLGAWLGRGLTGIYADVFRLPVLTYQLHLPIVLASILASLAAAAVGALASARRVMRLAPAEAMRPPSPAVYRPLLVERLGVQRLIAHSWRMVIRELERHPLRSLLSIAGIAVSTATLVIGRFSYDSIAHLIDVQFGAATHEDLSVTFTDPVPSRAARELAHLPGVLKSEGMRVVAVRLQAGNVRRDVLLTGRDPAAELRPLVDRAGHAVPMETDGLLLTTKLGEILRVVPGDSVNVEVLEGERRTVRVPVNGFVDEMFGLQGHMPLAALNRLLRESPAISLANLRVAPEHDADVRRRLAALPRVASITSPAAERAHLERGAARSQTVTTLVITIFAALITVGVVYNNARIALSMRSRELASLRVLGFTRGEISQILLGELGIQVLLAIPPGLLLGRWLTWVITAPIDAERFRWPVIISSATYAFAATVVLVAAAASALMVRRHLDRLDLIGVLKTRE